MNQDDSRSDEVLRSFQSFVSEGCGIELYDYQLQPARAILDSVRMGLGLTIVLEFPERSGTDELLAQLETYLMRMVDDLRHNIVVLNPTDEANLTSVMRLGDRLKSNIFTSFSWKMVGMNFILGRCRTVFYSMEAIIPGKPNPASLLLIVNEAENIHPEVFDHLNVLLTEGRKLTRLICGSEYDVDGFMPREIGRAIQDEKMDGIKRFFKVTEAQARKENKVLDFTLANLGELYGEREKEFKTVFCRE